MRKWGILAAVLLLGAVTAFRLLQQRGTGAAGTTLPAQVVPAGQPLPTDATAYFIPEEFMSVPPRTGAPESYGPLPTIKNEIYDSGPCKGGALNEILSAHGRVWGYEARHGAFREADTAEIYDLAARYLACVGLARRAPEYCDYLPAEKGVSRKMEFFDAPNYACRKYYMDVSLPGFAAGRDQGDESCAVFLGSAELSEGRRFLRSEFCSAASAGIANICPKYAPAIGKRELDQCRLLFPGGDNDCGSDGACRARLETARAMKAGDAAACPEKSRGLCKAFLTKSEASCSVLLVNLGSAYCRHLAAAQKRAQGYAGHSPAELAAALKRDAAEKVEAELRLKEQRRIEEEVNARAKKLLGGKQAGTP